MPLGPSRPQAVHHSAWYLNKNQENQSLGLPAQDLIKYLSLLLLWDWWIWHRQSSLTTAHLKSHPVSNRLKDEICATANEDRRRSTSISCYLSINSMKAAKSSKASSKLQVVLKLSGSHRHPGVQLLLPSLSLLLRPGASKASGWQLDESCDQLRQHHDQTVAVN